MARKNRVTVPDGIYHITSRVCNKAMLFKLDAVKEKIKRWIFDIADFSGVEIYSWCIMDNHLHLLVHVPRVPERLWTNPDQEPASWAFGMRPPECNPPLWTENIAQTGSASDGDCPQGIASTDDVHPRNVWRMLPRPSVGFMLEDDEMLDRLAFLYSKKTAAEIGVRWRELREKKRDSEVDVEKEKYCRRMYNISQFIKTLKERIAMRYNTEFDHEGCLWQGRFYSGIVENNPEVLSVVAGYIDYNPVKAKLVRIPERWKFSSWSAALGSGHEAVRCRNMYCKMLGCEWHDAKVIMSSVLGDELPEGVTPEDVRGWYDKYDDDDSAQIREADRQKKGVAQKLRASQAIRCGMWFFKKGGYIGRTLDFAWQSVLHLPIGFPRTGFLSVKRCRAFIWICPAHNDRGGAALAA